MMQIHFLLTLGLTGTTACVGRNKTSAGLAVGSRYTTYCVTISMILEYVWKSKSTTLTDTWNYHCCRFHVWKPTLAHSYWENAQFWHYNLFNLMSGVRSVAHIFIKIWFWQYTKDIIIKLIKLGTKSAFSLCSWITFIFCVPCVAK